MARTTTKAAEQPKGKVAAARGAAKPPAAKVGTATKAKGVAKAAEPVAASAPAKAGRPKAAPTKAPTPQPPSKPAKAPVVTLKHLAAGVSERRGTSKPEAQTFAATLIEDLVGQVKAGARVKLPGLGVIEIRDRPARMGRNPATGEPVQIAASRKIVFRPAKELKEAI